MLEIKPEQANKIKELMSKDTNNFYPFRKDGKVVGYNVCISNLRFIE